MLRPPLLLLSPPTHSGNSAKRRPTLEGVSSFRKQGEGGDNAAWMSSITRCVKGKEPVHDVRSGPRLPVSNRRGCTHMKEEVGFGAARV